MLKETSSKIFGIIESSVKSSFWKCVQFLGSRRMIFTFIYKFNIWGNPESKSGDGSSLQYTENLRIELPQLIEELDLRNILDAPCGDFLWFSSLLKESNLQIDYLGVDIVKELIAKNHEKFSNDKHIRFECSDLVKKQFGQFDLVISRDFLFHLSENDIRRFLENFYRSNSRYLLTTSYPGTKVNKPISSGKFREINLFEKPFLFIDQQNLKITDYVEPFSERYLYLFSREQVGFALEGQRKLKLNEA